MVGLFGEIFSWTVSIAERRNLIRVRGLTPVGVGVGWEEEEEGWSGSDGGGGASASGLGLGSIVAVVVDVASSM